MLITVIEAMKETERINDRNMIQYSGILLFIVLLFTTILLIAKFKVPFAFVDGLVFITFLLFYELILVVSEPWIDDWTSNIPIYKLGVNLTVAFMFIPFHRYEKKMRLKYKGI